MFCRIKRPSIFLLFLLAVLTGPGGGALDGHMAQAETVSSAGPSIEWEPAPKAIGQGNSGQLSISASEAIKLLYAGKDKGKTRILYSHSHNMGDSFSPGHAVHGEAEKVSSHGENGPQLETGLGIEIYATWEGNQDVRFARSMDFGRNFSESVRVNDDEGDAFQSFFDTEVAPDGAVYVAWLDGRDKATNKPGTFSLYISRSQDRGTTFSKNVKIAGDICPCCRPSITFGSSGEVFIAWRHVYDNHERVVVVAASRDGGQTWAEPVRVTQTGWVIDGCPHAGPSMRYIGGKLYVTWYTAIDRRAVIKLAVSDDQGRSFKHVKEIQGGVLDPTHPYIAESKDAAYVIFQGRDPQLKSGWAPARAWVVQAHGDGSVTDPQGLPSKGNGVAYPYLFMGNGGRVYATWTEFGEQGAEVILCRGRIQPQS
ncbi:sialidase family protein [Nitrospina watsonii]|uniref:Sialidase domain-containing protein n=1 Tax=Nitrospina watsonii TaxID=1323948 RepID=A0ABM9HC64_9BACT|nr:sialidase family protein [Nitrospina watsonii]CAI2717672.1 Sialidase domain-containing protein [Nitrospina watsonii]